MLVVCGHMVPYGAHVPHVSARVCFSHAQLMRIQPRRLWIVCAIDAYSLEDRGSTQWERPDVAQSFARVLRLISSSSSQPLSAILCGHFDTHWWGPSACNSAALAQICSRLLAPYRRSLIQQAHPGLTFQLLLRKGGWFNFLAALHHEPFRAWYFCALTFPAR